MAIYIRNRENPDTGSALSIKLKEVATMMAISKIRPVKIKPTIDKKMPHLRVVFK